MPSRCLDRDAAGIWAVLSFLLRFFRAHLLGLAMKAVFIPAAVVLIAPFIPDKEFP
jgi:hypothetical protein